MGIGSKWALFEHFGKRPFITRFMDRDGTVGKRFFEELALENNMGLRKVPGAGIIKSAEEDLGSDSFDARALRPIVRDVYERTSAMEFVAEHIEWTWHGKIRRALFLEASLLTREQLQIPKSSVSLPATMKSDVALLDVERDGLIDHRVWVRYFEETGRLYYAAAVDTHKTLGPRGEQSYLDVVLPLWRRNLTTVFQPSNRADGGLTLRTHQPGSYDAGLYLVIPGRRRYFMMPFFGVREEIQLEPSEDERGEFIQGTHYNRWFSLPTFTFRYTLRYGKRAMTSEASPT